LKKQKEALGKAVLNQQKRKADFAKKFSGEESKKKKEKDDAARQAFAKAQRLAKEAAGQVKNLTAGIAYW